jgi:hypothetical protein
MSANRVEYHEGAAALLNYFQNHSQIVLRIDLFFLRGNVGRTWGRTWGDERGDGRTWDERGDNERGETNVGTDGTFTSFSCAQWHEETGLRPVCPQFFRPQFFPQFFPSSSSFSYRPWATLGWKRGDYETVLGDGSGV